MKVVWKKGSATVRDVYETLREGRALAYTTVMTTMNILETKGFLENRVRIAPSLHADPIAPAGGRRDGEGLRQPRLRRGSAAAAAAPGDLGDADAEGAHRTEPLIEKTPAKDGEDA